MHVPQNGKAPCTEGAPKKGKILYVYTRYAHVGENFVKRTYEGRTVSHEQQFFVK